MAHTGKAVQAATVLVVAGVPVATLNVPAGQGKQVGGAMGHANLEAERAVAI